MKKFCGSKLSRVFTMGALLVALACATGCSADNNNDQSATTAPTETPAATETPEGATDSNESTGVVEIKAIETTPIVTMQIKDYGEIKLELYPEFAPNTVNNFIELANSGFYDGLTFHRIIPGFMIQGGDPEGTGTGGPGYSIPGEFTSNGSKTNTLAHTKGVLSMARSGAPNSAGSQFFIMTGDSPHLDGEYAAFGKVIEGIEIVESMGIVETGANDKPNEDVVIESITVETNGVEVPEVLKLK